MAKRSDFSTSGPKPGEAAGSSTDSREQRLVAFAEQLGWIVGTVQRKAEGWLTSEALTAQISKVRDNASALLDQLPAPPAAGSQRASSSKKNAGATRAKTAPSAPVTTKRGENSSGAGNAKVSSKGRVASKVRASATSGAGGNSGDRGRSGGAVDAPGKKHRKPVPSESGATGAPRGEGSRIAKMTAHTQNRIQRRG